MYNSIIHMKLFSIIFFTFPILGHALSGYYLFEANLRPSTFIATKKLIRPENCLPTAALNIAGACILAGPKSITSPPFLASLAITQSIMASSMVINDIIDLPVDSINNPTRPLVVGDVSKGYAITLATSLLVLAEFLNLRYIPTALQYITHLSAALAIFYTPIFKRILFVKNLSCAALVSSSMLFSGLVAANVGGTLQSFDYSRKAFSTLAVATRLVFAGSLCNEILLDISDWEGDTKQGIHTLPTVFGDKTAWQIAYSIMYLNIITNSMDMVRVHGLWRGYGLLFICTPLLRMLRDVKANEYSGQSIKRYCKKTVGPMLLFLVYLAVGGTPGSDDRRSSNGARFAGSSPLDPLPPFG